MKFEDLSPELKEQIKACKTPEEVLAFAKEEGYELTREEAEAYMAEMDDVELDGEALKKVAGGLCYGVGFASLADL